MNQNGDFTGAYHTNEFPYIFDTWIFSDKFEFSADDREYQRLLLESIVEFVKTGKPSNGTMKWKPTSKKYPSRYLSLRPQGSHMVEAYKPENVHFWTKIVSKEVTSHILKGKRFQKPGGPEHTHEEL
ncbi:unnamed protein product [Anisakis simplex]|uniref:COesterase domain-containing protein n=1 Tax=Anisakis simplex TaxID=6269 RepID=A0A0M3KJQ3_ANISI|nr:unnamed protein product [Anisakis simplex]